MRVRKADLYQHFSYTYTLKQMPYEAYDPATYSKPVEEFSPEDQPFVDIDILK